MWQVIGAANVYMPKKNSFEVFLDEVGSFDTICARYLFIIAVLLATHDRSTIYMWLRRTIGV
jgi:hypothetical protein